MPQANGARGKPREVLVHLAKKYFEIHIPTPTAVRDAGVAVATGKVQDTE